MKITLGEIVGNVENLKSLQEVKLPIKVSYRLMRLINKLEPILKSYNEKRDEIIKELGEEQEDGSVAIKKPEDLKTFTDRITELLKETEEVEFTPFKVEELGEAVLPPKLLINFLFE